MTESPRKPCPPGQHYWLPIYHQVEPAWKQLAEKGYIGIDAYCVSCREVMLGWHGTGSVPPLLTADGVQS